MLSSADVRQVVDRIDSLVRSHPAVFTLTDSDGDMLVLNDADEDSEGGIFYLLTTTAGLYLTRDSARMLVATLALALDEFEQTGEPE